MAQKTLSAVAKQISAKHIRIIVPKNEPVLDRTGQNDYVCPNCRIVLIRGAEPGAVSAKPLVLICHCGTHCATGPIET